MTPYEIYFGYAHNLKRSNNLHNHGAGLAVYDRMRGFASQSGAIVPGHDPLVMACYPTAQSGLEDTVVRVDIGPIG